MKKSKNVEKDLEVFKKIITDLQELNKRSLNRIKYYLDETKSDKIYLSDDKRDLIGIVPDLLTNRKIVPTNKEIYKIGKELGIELPFWEKKSYEEIVGRIIVAISRFDEEKLKQVNKLFKSLSPQIEKQDKDTFFSEWEKAIKKVVRKDD